MKRIIIWRGDFQLAAERIRQSERLNYVRAKFRSQVEERLRGVHEEICVNQSIPVNAPTEGAAGVIVLLE